MRYHLISILFGLLSILTLSTRLEAQNSNPDIPDFARYKINKEEFMRLRNEAIGKLRGIDQTRVFNPRLRGQGIRQMVVQQNQMALMAAQSPGTLATLPTWTPIGPAPIPNGQTPIVSTAVSGRTTAIAVHPTNPDIVYVGVAQGGVYRTTNGGANWTAIFDAAESLAIGSIAISPSQPETIYVGTGEPHFSGDSYFGVGVYRIDNASTTATLSGPFNLNAGAADVFTGRAIGKIIVHPSNPAIIFVSSTSGVGGLRAAANNVLPDRGIFRCSNATSANPVFDRLTGLMANANVSVRDLAIDPLNPDILVCVPVLAGSVTGGIYRSTNALAAAPASVTFTQTLAITSASTSEANGELAVVHPAGDTDATFYAAMGFSNGRVYKSLNGGASWTMQVDNNFCGGQCFYDIAIAVDPVNPNLVYLGGDPALVSARSTNGGLSFTDNKSGVHVDTHAFAVSLSNPSQVWVGTDGGIYKSTDAGLTWVNKNNGEFSATQFMSIAVHPTDANFTIGGTQDNGTNIFQPAGTWTRTDYGDGGFAQIDQNAANVTNVRMYHTYFNATSLQGYATTNSASAFENWTFRGCQGNGITGNGITCNGVVNFYAPLERGPGNPNTIYYGSDRLYRSANEGLNHTVVSQNPIVAGVPISAIGISPQDDNVRLVGLNNGALFGTSTGSSTLLNLDAGDVVPNVAIGRAIIDPTSASTAYVTLSAFGYNSVWKTTDLYAANPTWTAVSSGLPQIPVSSFLVNPVNPLNLYAGTDIGVYSSTDGGASWNPYGTGLPVVAVFGMAIAPGNVLRIATHGRGMWQTSLPACFPPPAPADVVITNSVCSPACVQSGGSIQAPPGAPCPAGFTLQYEVNGAGWSNTLPVYNQSGPAQTIKTRCACELDMDVVSEASAGVTTVPGPCNLPVVTYPQVTQPTCLLPTGRIIVKATGTETMQYSINNGVTYKNTASFAGLAPGNYNVVVRYLANPGCVKALANNPIVINPVPALIAPAAISGPAGVCRNATGQVFSVAPVEGAVSYQWTLPFGASGSSTTNSISLSFSSTYTSGNICVKAINSCGQSPQFCREIKYYGAKPLTPEAITGKTIGLCSQQTYSVPAVLNATNYIWAAPTGASIVSGQGTTEVVLSFGSSFVSGNLSVSASNCKGTSNARTLALSRNPATPASITGPVTAVCAGSTQVYSCPAVTGATLYTWTVPAGAVIAGGQGTTSITVNFPATFVSGNIKVASGTSCSSGTPKSVSVSSKPSFPAAITGPVSVCPSATGLQYSTTPVAGVTYNWTVPGGAVITGGQGTATVTINWGTVAGQVKVAALNACGSSAYRGLSVSLLTCAPGAITMAKAEPSETGEKLRFQVSPNPAGEILMVTLDEFLPNRKMEILLMQADGKVQQAQSLTPTLKGQQVSMNVSRAAVGNYILMVKQAGLAINRQVVIMR